MNRIRYCLGAICVAGLTLGAPAQARDIAVVGRDVPTEGEKVALIVGLDRYANPSALGTLRYARKDAEDLARTLKAQGFAVHLMTRADGADLPSNPSVIRRRLQRLALDVTKGGTLLFYFSGHGFAEKSDGKWRNYVCPYDADPTNLKATALALSDIEAILRGPKCKARRKLIIVDACRNDPNARSLVSGYSSEALQASRGIGHLYSTAPGTRSYEPSGAIARALGNTKIHNGLFTHFLLGGIHGAAETNGDGFITFRELALHVGEEMRKLRTRLQGYEQEPYTAWDGPSTDDVLIARAAEQPARPPVARPTPPAATGSPGNPSRPRPIVTVDDYLAAAQVHLNELKGTAVCREYQARVRKLEGGNKATTRAIPGRREHGAFWNEAWIAKGHLLDRPRARHHKLAADALHQLFESWWSNGGRERLIAQSPTPEPGPATDSSSSTSIDAYLAQAQKHLNTLRGAAVRRTWSARLRKELNGDTRSFRGLPGNRQPGSIWSESWGRHGAALARGRTVAARQKREAAAKLHALFDAWWAAGGKNHFGR